MKLLKVESEIERTLGQVRYRKFPLFGFSARLCTCPVIFVLPFCTIYRRSCGAFLLLNRFDALKLLKITFSDLIGPYCYR